MFFKILQENRKLRKENKLLKKEARTDYLTGLLNRRGIEERIAEEGERIERYNAKNFSMLFLDLDKLKKINDTKGYDEGDRAIQKAAEIIEKNLRKVDVPARVGGDEFLVLLPETTTREALTAAEKIRKKASREGIMISAGVGREKEKAQKEMQKEKRSKN